MAYLGHPKEINVTVNDIGQLHLRLLFRYEPMESTLVLSPEDAAKLYEDLGRAIGKKRPKADKPVTREARPGEHVTGWKDQ
jgi:hypothetical protein